MNSRCYQRLAAVPVLLSCFLLAGCMWPGMYYGSPYRQPMYAPPGVVNQTPPGTLVIPESNAPPYEPGRTYDSDPDDDFRRSDDDRDGRFYGSDDDDNAPLPKDLDRNMFDNDLGGPSTQRIEESAIQQASYTESPAEYGFDTANYRWLRGVVHFDSAVNAWAITYSIAADDRYRGRLSLNLTAKQSAQLTNGAAVDVHGHVDSEISDQYGLPVYHVDSVHGVTMPAEM